MVGKAATVAGITAALRGLSRKSTQGFGGIKRRCSQMNSAHGLQMLHSSCQESQIFP